MLRNVVSAIEIFQKINYVASLSFAKYCFAQRSLSFQLPPKTQVLQTLEIFLPSYLYNDGFFYSVGHHFHTKRDLGI